MNTPPDEITQDGDNADSSALPPLEHDALWPEQDVNSASQQAGESTAPAILSSKNLDLPADTESPEFAQGLTALRPLYETRTEFNFMVCDQLAVRGVPPNGMNVRLAGRWGNPAAVGSDVKLWYTALATRLSAEHAKIPEALKRGANDLLEQMWSLAMEAFKEPARKQLDDLSNELMVALSDGEHKNLKITKLEQDMVELKNNAIEQVMLLSRSLTEKTTEAASLADKVVQLQTSIAEAALAHEQEKRSISQAYEARLLQAHREREQSEQKHSQDVALIESKLQRERDRYDEASKANAMTVDRFRQDLKEAGQRADATLKQLDQTKTLANDLKEQLATSNGKLTLAERMLQMEAARRTDQEETIAGQSARIKSLETELLENKTASSKDDGYPGQ